MNDTKRYIVVIIYFLPDFIDSSYKKISCLSIPEQSGDQFYVVIMLLYII